jgi:hypothetical protein
MDAGVLPRKRHRFVAGAWCVDGGGRSFFCTAPAVRTASGLTKEGKKKSIAKFEELY